MDGLDELMSDLQQSKSGRQQLESSTPNGEDDWEWDDMDSGKDEELRRRCSVSGAVSRAEEAVHGFLTDLVDSSVKAELECYLCDISFRSFMEYYLLNPDLAEYTVHHELKRMEYSVIYDNTTTRDVSFIQSIYESTKMEDVWRLANQSIYANAVYAVQELYLSPELTVILHALSSKFVIDIDRSVVKASGKFEFSAPITLDGDKHHFATMDIHIIVDLSQMTVQHLIDTPVVNVVFDSDISKISTCAIELLSDSGGSEKYKWFAKISSIVDARSQLLSQKLKSSTGILFISCLSPKKVLLSLIFDDRRLVIICLFIFYN